MNGYVAIWKGKRIEVEAMSLYEAQNKAEKEFQKGSRKKVKGWDIILVLAEKDGVQVTHSTGGI